jgi:hypothetical protein
MTDFISSLTVEIPHGQCVNAVEELRNLVRIGAKETELQKHLEKFPFILSQQFSHCNHLVSQFNLGGKYQADFLCLNMPSRNYHWCGIEIESSTKAVITNNLRRSSVLEHALQQIRDWRDYLNANNDFAQRAKSKSGLGLEYSVYNIPGMVIIGRRIHDESILASWNNLRSQIQANDNIKVMSWDGIIDHAMNRAMLFDSIANNGINVDLGDGNKINLKLSKGNS